MTPRDQLRDFIRQVGIIEAWVKLGSYPIALERMRDGIDPIPNDVQRKLEDYTGPARFNCRLMAERAVRMLAQAQKANGKLREENARLKALIAAGKPPVGS